MSVRKMNPTRELKRLKRGMAPIDKSVIEWAEKWVEYGMAEYTKRDDVSQLERLFKLEDPR